MLSVRTSHLLMELAWTCVEEVDKHFTDHFDHSTLQMMFIEFLMDSMDQIFTPNSEGWIHTRHECNGPNCNLCNRGPPDEMTIQIEAPIGTDPRELLWMGRPFTIIYYRHDMGEASEPPSSCPSEVTDLPDLADLSLNDGEEIKKD